MRCEDVLALLLQSSGSSTCSHWTSRRDLQWRTFINCRLEIGGQREQAERKRGLVSETGSAVCEVLLLFVSPTVAFLCLVDVDRVAVCPPTSEWQRLVC